MIKKHRNKNEYFYAGEGLWVRNFTKKVPYPVDINNLIPPSDMQLLLDNESANKSQMIQGIDTESFNHPHIAIINSGFGFEKEQDILGALPPDVVIMGVNETMAKWTVNRRMHYYVANNPYGECLDFLPAQQRVRPRCIVSTRTNPEFISRYDGIVYEYTPVHDLQYAGIGGEADYHIDDYRSPVCAAIGLAFKFGVKKLMLFFLDEVYKEQRPACVKIKEDMWMYPQQITAHQLVDGNLFWLKEAKIKLGVYSHGLGYKHASYIGLADFANFFS